MTTIFQLSSSLNRREAPPWEGTQANAIPGFLNATGLQGCALTPMPGGHAQMAVASEPRANALFARLPADELARLERHLDLRFLPRGRTLYHFGDSDGALYFPTTAVLGLLADPRTGLKGQVGMIGHEGMVGAPLGMHPEMHLPHHRCVVQVPGYVFRIRIDLLTRLRRSALYSLAERHSYAMGSHISLTCECIRRHSLLEQLCRWLLMMRDRTRNSSLPVLEMCIARRLAHSRQEIGVVLSVLSGLGWLRVSADQIEILAPESLERAVCPCYTWLKEDHHGFLGLDLSGR